MSISLGINHSKGDSKKLVAKYEYLIHKQDTLYHEMSDSDTGTMLNFNTLIDKLTTEHNWLLDMAHQDNLFKFSGRNYRYSASRYFEVDGNLVTCSVELRLNATGNLIALNHGVISLQGDGLMYTDFDKRLHLDDINNIGVDELIAHIHSTMNTLLDRLKAETVTEINPHSINKDAVGFKGMGSITMMYIDRSTDTAKHIESYCFDNYRLRQKKHDASAAA